jgi:hypothetical protein
LNESKFAELFVTDHLVSVVVNAAEDGLNVVTARVEAVAFQVLDKVGDANRVEAARHIVEGANLDKVGTSSKMALTFVTMALKGHLLLEKTYK